MSQRDPLVRSAYNKAYLAQHGDHIRARKRARYAANFEQERAKLRARYEMNRDAELLRAASYRAAHPEQVLEATRRWRRENAEVIQAKRAQDYAANPEYYRAKARQHYAKHPEKMRERNAARDKRKMVESTRRWQKAHPEEVKEGKARYLARRRLASIVDLTAAQWREIKAAYGQRCVYCGRKMQRLTRDHITPLVKGGSHTYSNIVPACTSCNSRKNAGDVLVPVQPLLLTVAKARATTRKTSSPTHVKG